jgi:hypothetical protein
MLRAGACLALLAAAFLTASCGREESEPRPSQAAPERTAKRAEPRVEELGVCSTRRFELSFGNGRVSVTDGGTELAFASYDERDVLRACAPKTEEIRLTPRRIREVARLYSGKELGELIHESTTVSCAAPSPIELSVHPSWDERGDVIGSGLAVAANVNGKLELLVTAGLKRGGAHSDHISYAARYCEPA